MLQIKKDNIKSHKHDIDNKLIKLSKTTQFKLEKQQYTVTVISKKCCLIQKKSKIVYKMVQFSVNHNNVTTVYKLQGIPKNSSVITTWP